MSTFSSMKIKKLAFNNNDDNTNSDSLDQSSAPTLLSSTTNQALSLIGQSNQSNNTNIMVLSNNSNNISSSSTSSSSSSSGLPSTSQCQVSSSSSSSLPSSVNNSNNNSNSNNSNSNNSNYQTVVSHLQTSSHLSPLYNSSCGDNNNSNKSILTSAITPTTTIGSINTSGTGSWTSQQQQQLTSTTSTNTNNNNNHKTQQQSQQNPNPYQQQRHQQTITNVSVESSSFIASSSIGAFTKANFLPVSTNTLLQLTPPLPSSSLILRKQQHQHSISNPATSTVVNNNNNNNNQNQIIANHNVLNYEDFGILRSNNINDIHLNHHNHHHHQASNRLQHNQQVSYNSKTSNNNNSNHNINNSNNSIQNSTNQLNTSLYEIPSVLLNRLSSSSSSSVAAVAAVATVTSSAPSSTSTSSNNLYRSSNKTSSSSSYVAPRNEYESLIKRYAELDSFHVEVVTKLSMTEAENRQHRKRNDEILQQLNQAMNVRESLQDELNLVCAKYDKACREIKELQDQLSKVKKQRDEANKECHNAMNGRNKANRERQQMYEERNIAIREYNLIMSERDSVHKEIEKLQEDLQELQKRNEILDKDFKMTSEELESLRRELASALLDRDRLLKTCNDLKEKYGESSLTSHHSQNSFNLYSHLPVQQDSQQSLQQLQSSADNSHYCGQEFSPSSNNNNTNSIVANNNSYSSSSNGSLIGSGAITSSSINTTNSIGVCGSVGNNNNNHQAQSPTQLSALNLKNLNLIKTANNSNNNPTIITTSSSTSSVSTFGATPQQYSTPLINNKTISITSNNNNTNFDNTNSSNNSLAQNLVNNNSNNSNENENLREQVKKLQCELKKALQEIDTWKIRRDWAINERDKIVLERESVRALCDKLRKERDRKNSDLADALRESIEIKRQKNETAKEFEILKEKFDSAMKANRSNNDNNKSNTNNAGESNKNNDNSVDKMASLTNEQSSVVVASPGITCTSQDSAIDVDEINNNNNNPTSSLLEAEIFDVKLERSSSDIEWGFQLGFDTVDKETPSIIVANVILNSIVEQSGLRTMDQIIKINDLALMINNSNNNDKDDCHNQLINAQSLINEELKINMKIRRRKFIRNMQTVSLPLLNNNVKDLNQDDSLPKMFGFTGELILIINRVNNNNNIENALITGDRIVSVNGTSLNKILLQYLLSCIAKSVDNHSNTVKFHFYRMYPMEYSYLKYQTIENKVVEGKPIETTVTTTKLIKDSSDSTLIDVDQSDQKNFNKSLILKKSTNSGDNIVSKSIDSVESEIDDEDEPRTTVDEDNDADEDEPNSDTETNNTEVKTIAKLDQMLEQYQKEDYYNGNDNQSTTAVDHQDDQNKKPIMNTTNANSSPTSSAVPRSIRTKKSKQRSTLLAATQLTSFVGQAFEKALSSSNNSHGSGSGDTWPRYRPHQFLSKILPSIYKNYDNDHDQENKKKGANNVYYLNQPLKQDPKRTPLTNLDLINNYATTTNRRKQRKSLGVYLDNFPNETLTNKSLSGKDSKSSTISASNNPASMNDNNTMISSQQTTLSNNDNIINQETNNGNKNTNNNDSNNNKNNDKNINNANTLTNVVTRRSPRHREHNSLYEPLYGQRILNNNNNNSIAVKTNNMVVDGDKYSSRPLSYDHQAAILNTYSHQQQQQHSMFQLAASATGNYVRQQSQYNQSQHLDLNSSKASLQRSLTYNSLKNHNNGMNYLVGGASNLSNYFYVSNNNEQPQTRPNQLSNTNSSINNYSPMYSKYSTVGYCDENEKDVNKNCNSNNVALQKQQQQSISSSQQSQQSNTELYESIYGTHSLKQQSISNQLVDYSVVSAQTYDKNVLKYYKIRQGANSNLNNAAGGNSCENVIQKQQQQQQPKPSRSHSLSQSYQNDHQTPLSVINAANSVNASVGLYDIYGQTCQPKIISNNLYGTIVAKNHSSSDRTSNNVRHSMTSSTLASNLAGSASNYYNLSSALTNIGIPHSHLLAYSSPYAKMTSNQSTNRILSNSSSIAASINQSNQRHSMNLSQNVQSLLPTRDSLMLANNNNNNEHSNINWDSELASCASSTSSKPSKTGLTISLPNAQRSYKDSFNYSTIFDSNLSSRASIASTQSSIAASMGNTSGALHQYSLSENIYDPNKEIIVSSPPPPPPAPSSQQYYTNTDNQLRNSSSFIDDAFTLTRSQRLRIPSNSSTVSSNNNTNTSNYSHKNNPKTFFMDKSFIMASAHPVNMGSNLGLIGDRNSYVSNSGSTAGPHIEVKWIKCSKDGSPGSPILDYRNAKPDDYRLITIDRSSATLGIRILHTLNDQKGVFVEGVTEGGLASQAGIRVGDQIIDICGINMRAADFENAAKVLKQCRDPIQMLVQRNYEKFKEIQSKQYHLSSLSSSSTIERDHQINNKNNNNQSSSSNKNNSSNNNNNNNSNNTNTSRKNSLEKKDLNSIVSDGSNTSRVRMPIVGSDANNIENAINCENSENSMLVYTA